MAITYTWNFGPLECIPSLDGLSNVVQTIHWRYVGTDGTHMASVYGSLTVPPPANTSNFIPYANLDINTVTTWVVSELGNTQVESYQTNIATQIANIITPPVTINTPPWASINTVSSNSVANSSSNK